MALAAVLTALMTFAVAFMALAVGEPVLAAAFVTAAVLAAASVVAAAWIDRPEWRPWRKAAMPEGGRSVRGAAAVLMAFAVVLMALPAFFVAYIAFAQGAPVIAASIVTVAALAASSVVAAVWIDRPGRRSSRKAAGK